MQTQTQQQTGAVLSRAAAALATFALGVCGIAGQMHTNTWSAYTLLYLPPPHLTQRSITLSPNPRVHHPSSTHPSPIGSLPPQSSPRERCFCIREFVEGGSGTTQARACDGAPASCLPSDCQASGTRGGGRPQRYGFSKHSGSLPVRKIHTNLYSTEVWFWFPNTSLKMR